MLSTISSVYGGFDIHLPTYIYVKTPTLIAYFSTKGKSFTVNQCYFTAGIYYDNEKFHCHKNDNYYHHNCHTFRLSHCTRLNQDPQK